MKAIIWLLLLLCFFQCGCNPYKRIQRDRYPSEKDLHILAEVCTKTFPVIPLQIDSTTSNPSDSAIDEVIRDYDRFIASLQGSQTVNMDSLKNAWVRKASNNLQSTKTITKRIADSAAIKKLQGDILLLSKAREQLSLQLVKAEAGHDAQRSARKNLIWWIIGLAVALGISIMINLRKLIPV